MSVSNSIAPFSLFSVTDSDFAWLQQDAWDPRHQEFFMQKRDYSASSFLNPIPTMNTRTALRCYRDRWVLEKSTHPTSILAWAEGHGFLQTYSSFFLFLGNDQPWADLAKKALSRLISTVIIATKCDQVRLIDVTHSGQLTGIEWGEAIEIMEFQRLKGFTTHSSPRPVHTQTLRISGYSWWDLPNAQTDRKHLRHLISTHQRQSKPKSLRKRRRKPAILRLFDLLTGKSNR